MASINDYYILAAINDKDDIEKGVIKIKGSTKEEIQSRLPHKLSITKITNTLEMFKKEGYVKDGIAIGKTKTYIITESGFDLIDEIFHEKDN